MCTKILIYFMISPFLSGYRERNTRERKELILKQAINIDNSYIEKLEYFEFGCLEHI